MPKMRFAGHREEALVDAPVKNFFTPSIEEGLLPGGWLRHAAKPRSDWQSFWFMV